MKNHRNALHNPYAQYPKRLTVQDVLSSEMISYPLMREQICTMSDGAAVAILCDETRAREFSDKPVRIAGVGCGTDTMRLADRPFGKVPLFPHEKASDYAKLPYPGVHSFRAGRAAGLEAYRMAGLTDPRKELDFIELHDAYASSEIQTYEDLGLCRYGEGYDFTLSGAPFLKNVDYGLEVRDAGKIPVNPSGGLDRLRPPGRSDRPHAGRVRLLAAPGRHPSAFRRRNAADQGRTSAGRSTATRGPDRP